MHHHTSLAEVLTMSSRIGFNNSLDVRDYRASYSTTEFVGNAFANLMAGSLSIRREQLCLIVGKEYFSADRGRQKLRSRE